MPFRWEHPEDEVEVEAQLRRQEQARLLYEARERQAYYEQILENPRNLGQRNLGQMEAVYWYPKTLGPHKPFAPEPELEEGVLANQFLVGTDPEWAVIDKGELKNLQNKLVGAEKASYDHGGYVVEIHPEPAKGTYTLLKRIQKLILQPALGKNLCPGKWLAGAKIGGIRVPGRLQDYVTLGGHVHIDLDPGEQRDAYNRASAEHNARIDALDTLTRRLESLEVFPSVSCEARRHCYEGTYGRFGDWRPNDDAVYGEEKRRFEYRTMPSWLYSPKVAFICLTGAKLACVDPEVTQSKLKSCSWKALISFFEAFKEKDINARRVVDKVAPFVGDPEIDVRDAWKELGV